MLPNNWIRGKRFIKRGPGLDPGLAVWLKIQQEMKENKVRKARNTDRKAEFNPGIVWNVAERMREDRTDYKSVFQCGRAYCRGLAKHGFVEIGNGAYSSIFSHPKWENKVLKVNRRIDPWPEYIRWAYTNGHQKFAPGVHSYKFYPGKPPEPDSTNFSPFYVAIVEKLSSEGQFRRDEGTEVELASDFFGKLLYAHHHPTTAVLADLYLPGLVKFTQDFKERFYVDEKGKRRNYTLDCFGGNQMLSMDGKRWVLNDPLCGRHMDESQLEGRIKNESRRSNLAA